MTLQAVLAYMRQPSSISGMGAMLGAFSAVVTHQITGLQAVPIVLGGALMILVKDNTSTILHQAQANGAVLASEAQAKK